MTDVTSISKFELQGAYCFRIDHPDRNFMLRADAADTLAKWMRALHMQADLARGGNIKSFMILATIYRLIFRTWYKSNCWTTNQKTTG